MTKNYSLSEIMQNIAKENFGAIQYTMLLALGTESEMEIEKLFLENNCQMNNFEGTINNVRFKIQTDFADEHEVESKLTFIPKNLTGIYRLGTVEEMLKHQQRFGFKLCQKNFRYQKVDRYNLELEILK